MTDAELAQLETRIGPAAHDPRRRHRQHPYRLTRSDGRAMRATLRDDAGAIIESMGGAIAQAVWKSSHFEDEATCEDLRADIHLHLFTKAIPAYDQTAGSKLSTFLYLCIQRFVIGKVRQRKRQRRLPTITLDASDLPNQLIATDQTEDRQVERIAAAVIESPDQFLKPHIAQAVSLLHQGNTQQEVAKMLGVTPSSLSSMLKRAGKRFLKSDIRSAEIMNQ